MFEWMPEWIVPSIISFFCSIFIFFWLLMAVTEHDKISYVECHQGPLTAPLHQYLLSTVYHPAQRKSMEHHQGLQALRHPDLHLTVLVDLLVNVLTVKTTWYIHILKGEWNAFLYRELKQRYVKLTKHCGKKGNYSAMSYFSVNP